ncbi:MAG: UDP-N-acetylmuramate dehydrogenase [Firmicutes bacterium]|nr:UDP-N-acetylmuramate dehydrogenase [Bacillota bacterium]
MEILRDVSLRDFTTFRIGGNAEYFAEAKSVSDLAAALKFSKVVTVIGRGSNLLVSDYGVKGLVVRIALAGVAVVDDDPGGKGCSHHESRIPNSEKTGTCGSQRGLATPTGMNVTIPNPESRTPNPEFRTPNPESRTVQTIAAYAGESLSALSRFYLKNGFSGLEWASGIPASVGGAVKMNAGAHGSDVAASVQWAEVLRDGAVVRLKTRECGFSYRRSGFLASDIIVRAGFAYRADGPARIAERMRGFSEYRRATQPAGRSAGSVFKAARSSGQGSGVRGQGSDDNISAIPNSSLLIPHTTLSELPTSYFLLPTFSDSIPAGRLIDRAGLKGTRIGGAVISQKHANFILNTDNASSDDVIKLIRLVKSRVFERFGVELEEEIQYVGEFSE